MINIIIDLILFLPPSPMQMSFTNYIMDIGLTYVMIPVITIGMAYMVDRSNYELILCQGGKITQIIKH